MCIRDRHDTGGTDIGTDHALHTGGERDIVVVETVVDAVGDRTVVVQRREDPLHCLEDVVDTSDVQVGLLLAGEGRVGQVLGGGGGPHRPGDLLGVGVVVDEVGVIVPDVLFECLGEGLVDDPLTDLPATLRQLGDILDVEVGEGLADPLVEAVEGEEVAVGVGGGGETCLLYTSPSPRDRTRSRMPSSA